MRKPKNKGRKFKKQRRKSLALNSRRRKMNREGHEAYIAYARKNHRNCWEMWTRGYPNRTRMLHWYRAFNYEKLILGSKRES